MDETQTFNMRVVDYICMTTTLGIAVEHLSKITGYSVQNITEALQIEAHGRMALFPPNHAEQAINQYHKDVESDVPYQITDIS